MITELFKKIERVAEQESKVKHLYPSDIDSLKAAFTEVLACCRAGVKTKHFAEFYERV